MNDNQKNLIVSFIQDKHGKESTTNINWIADFLLKPQKDQFDEIKSFLEVKRAELIISLSNLDAQKTSTENTLNQMVSDIDAVKLQL